MSYCKTQAIHTLSSQKPTKRVPERGCSHAKLGTSGLRGSRAPHPPLSVCCRAMPHPLFFSLWSWSRRYPVGGWLACPVGALREVFFSLPFEVGMGGEGGGSAWANFVGCLLRVVRHQKSGRGWMDDGWTDACEVKPGRSASSDAENPSWGVAGTRRQGGPKGSFPSWAGFCFPSLKPFFSCRGGLALDDPSLVAGWLSGAGCPVGLSVSAVPTPHHVDSGYVGIHP